MKFRTIAYIFYVLLSVPFVFLPIGYDYSVFLLAGKILANGGHLYIDYIDIKPPLLYYCFYILYILFKNIWILYQILNALIIFFSAITLFEITYTIYKDKWLSTISPIPMLLFYASYDYNYIFEPELVFVLVFCIVTLSLIKNPSSRFTAISIGALSGFLFGLKYSFGIIILSVCYYLYTEVDPKIRMKQICTYLVTFIIVSVIPFVILFIHNGTLKPFIHIINFLVYYQSTTNLSMESLKRILSSAETIFGIHFSLVFSIAFFYGIWNKLQNWNSLEKSERSIQYFFLLSFLLIFFTIFVERHFLPYHFLRLSPQLSFYAAFALLAIQREAKKLPRKVLYLLIPLAIYVVIFHTPLARFIRTVLPTYYYFTNYEKYLNLFENPETQHTLLRQHTTIVRRLNPEIKPTDTVVVLGVATQIYTLLYDCHFTAFPASVFVLSKFDVPKEWKARFLKELNTAKFLIIQENDYKHFFKEIQTTWQEFNKHTIYKNILESQYSLYFRTYSFYVYKRKQ